MLSKFYRLRRKAFSARKVSQCLTGFLVVLLLSAPLVVAAEEAVSENPIKNRYRVELLLFTAKDPADKESLGQALAPQIPAGAELLFGELPVLVPTSGDSQGAIGTSAEKATTAADDVKAFSKPLLNSGNLHLSGARSRLQNSGRYNVQFLVGWTEAFPPGHKTPPLLLRVGNSVEGYSDIQGFIQVDRQRYLHVNAQIFDLNLNPIKGGPRLATEATISQPDGTSGTPAVDPFLLDPPIIDVAEQDPAPEIEGWLRETRRMRSGEVHLLDSPTMGLLVYFEPLD